MDMNLKGLILLLITILVGIFLLRMHLLNSCILSKNGLESVVLPITSNECSERKSNFR